MLKEAKKYHITLKDLSFFDESDFKGKVGNKSAKDIVFTKLSNLERNPKDFILGMNGDKGKQREPIVFYDYSFGNFRAGRYVGNIVIDDETILSIRPRFESFFNKIAGEVLNLKILNNGSILHNQDLFNWNFIYLLFSNHLKKAYSKGLPINRKLEYKTGKTIIGQLDVKKTLKTFYLGNLVSRSRDKNLDSSIVLPLVKANEVLTHKVSKDIETEKIITDLISFSQDIPIDKYRGLYNKIKYTPMSIFYKPAVQLAEHIINKNNNKIGSSSFDENQISVLFDIAEIWEHYCYKFLRKQFSNLDVIYSANETHGFAVIGEKFKLKPDFVIKRDGKIVAIADAKYKYSHGKDREHGTTREDLYQMITYLNSNIGKWQNPNDKKCFLLYPNFPDSDNRSKIDNRNYTLNMTDDKSKIIRILLDDKMESAFKIEPL